MCQDANMPQATPGVIQVKDLSYRYKTRGVDSRLVSLKDCNLSIPKGARVLLVGQNGAGKSTLMRIMAGRSMVPMGQCQCLGKDAFHDTTLTREVSYLGEWWAQTRNFLDITVANILGEISEEQRPRVEELCKVLRVDMSWRLGCLSDGQLRRSQILFGLAEFRPIIILDEITTDVDILVRDSLLTFLRKESEERGATILYATHIFEGTEEWAPTHMLRLIEGEAILLRTQDEIPELREDPSIYHLVRGWLRKERLLPEVTRRPNWLELADGLKL
eukprot:TRINITY_DN770_c0_g2_i1.p1 TRINITY_DN770_c0_g2~~TRINITY_DN770_c0_g2_i1.p1  ORF type:complete len:275 (+),score=139.93 TRINITY_DN770_c0_g2_i1:72-896(+)